MSRVTSHVSRVQVYGEKDADGFYWGEAGPRQGFVPCNMVSEVQVGGAVLLRDNLILLAGEGAGCDTRQVPGVAPPLHNPRTNHSQLARLTTAANLVTFAAF